MYKRIDFTQLEGLGFTQDTLNFLQESYREALASVASVLGDYVIISGVNVAGSNYTDGWVAINGELLPFTGGLIASNIIIEETSANELFADGNNKAVYFTRRAKLASSGGTAFSSFVRLNTIKYLTQQIALKSNIASPAFTGTPTAPTASPGTNTTQLSTTAFVKALGDLKANLASPAFTGTPSAPTAALGTNTTQLATTAFVKAALDALVDASPGALDTLNELAAALGDDPNFATTITNLIATKVSKSGDTMTGNLSVPAATTSGHAVNKGQHDLKANKAQSGWINITLANGWAVGNSATPQYRIDEFGQVHLRGQLNAASSTSANVTAAGAVPNVPTTSHTFVVSSGDNNAGDIFRISITTTGQISIISSDYLTTERYRLEGISYWTEAF